jgi:carbon-monoxide dehydrogenase medium subunit
MTLWQRYHRPQTVADALSLLARYEGRARVVSGGTDLLLEMQQGRRPSLEALVDVTAIDDMVYVRRQESWIEIGAAATHAQIVKSELVVQQATCLVESCGVIGGPQVRNVATLGGNVAHARPAADGTTALVAMAAEAEVATGDGRAWHPILHLFKGPGKSAVDQTLQLITRFRFPAARPGTGTAFKRVMRPQGVALPILACAAWVQVGSRSQPDSEGRLLPTEDAVIEDVRICIGPVRPVPCRARETEGVLHGRSLAAALDEAVVAVQAEFSPRTSKHRATSAYRVEMLEILLRRTLPLAVRRALTGQAVPEGLGLQ